MPNFTVKQQIVMLCFCKTCFCCLTKCFFSAIIVLSKKRRKYNVLQGNSLGGRGENLEKGEPLYEERNTLPTLMENVEKAKITNVEGISFYAELEYLTAKNKGLTHFWKREGHCVESGEKSYGFLVERNNIWYSVIGKWKNEEDAKQELAAYGYKIVG